jgi:hypothetical protein
MPVPKAAVVSYDNSEAVQGCKRAAEHCRSRQSVVMRGSLKAAREVVAACPACSTTTPSSTGSWRMACQTLAPMDVDCRHCHSRRPLTGWAGGCLTPPRSGGEAQAGGQPRANWPFDRLLCLSAALSRRFSSSTKAYMSTEICLPAFVSPSKCSHLPPI